MKNITLKKRLNSKPRKVWILWDLDNGNSKRDCYLWICETYAEAIRIQHKSIQYKHRAKLSVPITGHVRMRHNVGNDYFHRSEVVGLKRGLSHPKW